MAVEDYAGAERAFAAATRLAPAEAEAWLGLAEALEHGRLRPREALGAYERALAAAGTGPVARRVRFAFRRFSASLAEDGRQGGVDPQLALEALVTAAREEADPAERERLRELALDVEARALARALLPALGSAPAKGLGNAVAVLPPEWPQPGRPAGRALNRLADLVAGALSERRQTAWRVRSPAESRERVRGAGGEPPRHADVHDPARRRALARALEAGLVVLLQGGQRVSARLVALAGGDVLPRGHAAVFHPSDAAFELAPAGPPLEAEVRLVARRRLPDGGEQEVLVTDGAVLRSGDKVRAHVRPSQQAHVIALWFDSEERVTRLFPDTHELYPGAPPLPANPIRRGDELIVPGARHGFALDDQTGTETLYVVVTREPLPEGEAGHLALALANGAQDPGGALRTWLEERAGALSGAAATTDEATTLIRGHGALVRSVWFRHE